MDMFNGVNTSPYGPNGTGPENIFYTIHKVGI
jgi:hypothetical protein